MYIEALWLYMYVCRPLTNKGCNIRLKLTGVPAEMIRSRYNDSRISRYIPNLLNHQIWIRTLSFLRRTLCARTVTHAAHLVWSILYESPT